MPVIPVRYESLKAILPYMDPNTRFQISLRMPSISALESRIPLKIKNLTFSKIHTEVNEVSYRLGVYRDYERNETPPDVHRMNEEGESFDDIDKYGVIINPGMNIVLPGDIALRTGVHRNVPAHREESEQNLVLKLRISKMILAERMNQEYIEDDETRNAIVDSPFYALMETRYRRMTLNTPVELIQSTIQALRDRLSAFNNRRNNQNLPNSLWMQLSVNSPKGITIQRVAYKKYLYEAEKALHTKLFGNRGSNISVKNLKVELPNRILRFPATVLKIENLTVSGWDSLVFERFKQVNHPLSFPLQQLKVSSSILTADFTHIITREAKSLIINNYTNDNGSWTPILLDLTNRIVCLENENRLNPPNNYVDLIENWLERGRPIGTCFYMGIKNEETVKQCLDTLRQRQEVIGSSEKQVQLRIDASLMLNVSYEMIEHSKHSYPTEYDSNLCLRLEVVRRRSE